MRKVIVADRQTIRDIAIQEYGSIEAVFKLVQDNPVLSNISSTLTTGMQLIIVDAPYNTEVYEYYVRNQVKPANQVTLPPKGNNPPPSNGDFNNDFNNDFY